MKTINHYNIVSPYFIEPAMYNLLAFRDEHAFNKTVHEGGVDINAVDRYGYTPLMRGLVVGRLKVSHWLLAAGADTSVIAPDGHNALSLAYTYRRMELVALLEAAGATFNPDADFQPRALWEAFRHDSPELLELLMKRGTTQNDNSPLLLRAVAMKARHCVNFLLKQGSNPDETDTDETPLQMAASMLDYNIMGSLIAAGADTKVRTAKGKSLTDIVNGVSVDSAGDLEDLSDEDLEDLRESCLDVLPFDEDEDE